MSETFVVIGGGVGGGTAALALRTEGFTGRIVVVCEENRPPYSKPPLSKGVLRGQESPDRTALRPKDWYDKKDIELITGVAAKHIDRDTRTVHLADGQELGYDKLLIATGGDARRMPGTDGIPGIFTLRTVEDSLAISERLKPGARVVVVGGGFIGAEVAASAVQMGCTVTVLEGLELPLQRMMPQMLGQLYMRMHQDKGVDFRTSVAITDFEHGPDGLVAHAADGSSYPADVIVIGVGMVPNDDIGLQAGLEVSNGIVVDGQCRTLDRDIFAIGDVANLPHPIIGERRRVEHWQNAQHQAKVAAKNMCGGNEEFLEVPWVWSDQYDVTIQITGVPEPLDKVYLRGDVDEWNFSAVLVRNGILRGCVAYNRTDDVRAVRRIMHDGLSVSLEHLTDPELDLTELADEAAAHKENA